MPKKKTNSKGTDQTEGAITPESNLPEKKKNYSGSVKIITEKGKKYGLNELQMKFCDTYLNDPALMGNGVRCYAEVYNINLARPGEYNKAKSMASQLLAQDNILKYLCDNLEEQELNDVMVDKHMSFIIRQKSDHMAAIQAIKVYNDLKNRIEKKPPVTAIQFNINLENKEGETQVRIEDK